MAYFAAIRSNRIVYGYIEGRFFQEQFESEEAMNQRTAPFPPMCTGETAEAPGLDRR